MEKVGRSFASAGTYIRDSKTRISRGNDVGFKDNLNAFRTRTMLEGSTSLIAVGFRLKQKRCAP